MSIKENAIRGPISSQSSRSGRVFCLSVSSRFPNRTGHAPRNRYLIKTKKAWLQSGTTPLQALLHYLTSSDNSSLGNTINNVIARLCVLSEKDSTCAMGPCVAPCICSICSRSQCIVVPLNIFYNIPECEKRHNPQMGTKMGINWLRQTPHALRRLQLDPISDTQRF